MKIHHITLSIIFVSMIILAIIGPTGWLTSLSENPHNSGTADFSGLNRTQERLETQRETINETYTTMQSMKLEKITDYIVIPYKLIKVGWASVKTVFGSWAVVGAIISDTTTELGDTGIPLPSWLVPSIMAIIILTIIAILIFAFFKWKFED